MEKVGIITLHRNTNYGANLQAFALQKYIKSLGYDVLIIDYLKSEFDYQNHLLAWLKESWKNSRGTRFIQKVKLFISLCLSIPSKLQRLYRFNKFRKLNCKLSKRCENNFDITNLEINTIICGSDQIWNPEITHGFDSIYFGEIDGVIKKISYAASLGKSKLNSTQESIIKNNLKSINYCSVRESDSAKYLNSISKIEIETVCDPTFLLDNKEYFALTKQRRIKNKYILLYSIIQNPDMTVFAEKFAQQKGLILIEICQNIKIGKKHKQFTNLGPTEFLTVFRDSEFIITNSFHGTAFAIIFEKQFIVFDNKERGSRILDLLKKIGLENRIYKTENI